MRVRRPTSRISAPGPWRILTVAASHAAPGGLRGDVDAARLVEHGLSRCRRSRGNVPAELPLPRSGAGAVRRSGGNVSPFRQRRRVDVQTPPDTGRRPSPCRDRLRAPPRLPSRWRPPDAARASAPRPHRRPRWPPQTRRPRPMPARAAPRRTPLRAPAAGPPRPPASAAPARRPSRRRSPTSAANGWRPGAVPLPAPRCGRRGASRGRFAPRAPPCRRARRRAGSARRGPRARAPGRRLARAPCASSATARRSGSRCSRSAGRTRGSARAARTWRPGCGRKGIPDGVADRRQGCTARGCQPKSAARVHERERAPPMCWTVAGANARTG